MKKKKKREKRKKEREKKKMNNGWNETEEDRSVIARQRDKLNARNDRTSKRSTIYTEWRETWEPRGTTFVKFRQPI